MKKVAQPNRVTTPMILIGLVMILLFLGLVVLLVAQREHFQTYDEARKEQRLKNLGDLNAENKKILTQYHWVDKAKGVVGIPIDRAINLVLAEMQSNRPHPAGPITTPPPAAGAGATPVAGGQLQNQGQRAPATGGQPAAPVASPAGASPAPAGLPNQPGASASSQGGRANP
jgi:hypothetical protein